MTNKVCIVTGGAGYLGSACCKALKDFGATVVSLDVLYSSENQPSKEEADLGLYCDLASTDSIKECFSKTQDIFGRIDVLVNCGIFGAGYGKDSRIEFMDDETWKKGIDGSLGVTFRGIREIVPYMKENGGSIINFCSMYGLVSPDLRIYGPDNPQTNPPNYGAGKAGVAQLTRYAACSLAKYNIRVNAVTPGPFPKPANATDSEFMASLGNKNMLGRTGKNHEIAGAVLLLASDASTYTTGSNIVVDGGWTAW
ncbi:MAG: SDR family oxidoreductase [Clostridia bacterium]|nr:SDR family oxidoreductase [Clostridia bacterium]